MQIRLKGMYITSPWIDSSRQYLSYAQYISSNNDLLNLNGTAQSDLQSIETACKNQIQSRPELTYIPACASIIDYIRSFVQQTEPGFCLNEYDMRLTPQGVCAGSVDYGDYVLLSILNDPTFRDSIHTLISGAPSFYLPCSSQVYTALTPDGSMPSHWLLSILTIWLGFPVTFVSGLADFITDAIGVGWALGNLTGDPNIQNTVPWTMPVDIAEEFNTNVTSTTIQRSATGLNDRVTWFVVDDAGHFVGEDQPDAASEILAYVLGKECTSSWLLCWWV
ncbi:hypothetical protein HDU76_004494 [Blyttiomyces sp. JEL0837]|nr:hypothetical protein HDU76_004494 [Blyttiomyces sp. JEL0837]